MESDWSWNVWYYGFQGPLVGEKLNRKVARWLGQPFEMCIGVQRDQLTPQDLWSSARLVEDRAQIGFFILVTPPESFPYVFSVEPDGHGET